MVRAASFVLPILVVLYWLLVINAQAYGKTSPTGMLLLLAAFAFVVLTIMFGFMSLSSAYRHQVRWFLYYASLSVLVISLLYYTKSAIDARIVSRIKNEETFALCKKAAIKVGKSTYYNVCESSDLTELAINNVFRDIVYDSSDELVFHPDKRPTIYGAFLGPDFDHREGVSKIADHYYVVTTSY